MLRTVPFLLFDGNCEEAMTFYHRCLGGELTVTRLGDTPMSGMFPPEKHQRLINSHLQNRAVEISASDWMASPALDPVQGNTSAVFLVGDDLGELRTAFDQLAEGAREVGFQFLHDLPFGLYGQFFDRFGVQWIFMGNRAP